MPDSRLATQLYTVRAFTQTPAEIAATLRKLKTIGYDAVQISALGAIEPEALRRIADDEGIAICASMVAFADLRADVAAQIATHQTLGCAHVATKGMSPADYPGAEGVAAFAVQANEVGRRLAEAGLTFSYHNHSDEFARVDGRRILDLIFEQTDPRYVKALLCTYWVQHGGGDPAAWIDRLGERVVLLHLKDMAIRPGRTQAFAEVGEGNLNWPRILPAAQAAGVQWYIVEQDNCYERDPFESLQISLMNCRAMGLA